METTYVSPEQLAEMLPGVSKGQLATWRYRGDGPPYQKLGKTVIYDLDLVRAWIEANTRTSTAEKVSA